jgi:putative SOS response-associated peptidase YedK
MAPNQVLSQNLNAELQFYRVGRQVNSPNYEEADCIEPINPL